MPEHTLAAYRQALDDGADALECDVRLTRDGHLVCVHDRRVDRTSTGRGPVSVHDLAELDRLAWGTGPGERQSVPDLDPERRTLLTLERLCEVVADVRRPVALVVEAKHPTRYGGLVEHRLVQVLRRFGWAQSAPGGVAPVRSMSFSLVAVRRIRRLAPALPTVLLFRRVPPLFQGGRLPYGVPISGPRLSVLRDDPAYVARAHANGTAVHVWTVDADEDVRYCAGLGVDAIITNRPRRVLDLLQR